MARKRFSILGELVGCSNKKKLNFDKNFCLQVRKFSDGTKNIVKIKNQTI